MNDCGHFHRESKDTALIDALGENVKFAAIFLDQRFGDHEAKPDSFMVHLCRAEQLAKLVAKLWDLFRCNACTAVTDLNFKKTIHVVISD